MPVIIKLIKSESTTPWGFRLHGGKDFGAPLTVQRINPGSIAAKCGLLIGDLITKIDSTSTSGLKHKDAQDLIVKAGNSIELTLCRGDEQPVQNATKTITQEISFNESKQQSGYNYGTTPEKLAGNVESLSIGGSYGAKEEKNKWQPAYPTPTSPPAYQAPAYQTPAYQTPAYQTPTSPPAYQAPAYQTPAYHTPAYQIPAYQTPAHLTTCQSQSGSNSSDTKKYIPSETCKLVQTIESGNEVPFNPRTGVEVKSTPIQSKLMDILEKKHGKFQSQVPREPAKSTGREPAQSTGREPAPSGGSKFSTGASSGYSPRPFVHANDTKKHVTMQHAKNMPEPSGAGLSGNKAPICNVCNSAIRGPYLMAVNKIWCPEHFLCSNPGCQRPLADCGFVEEEGQLFCLQDYERYFAPRCVKCDEPIVGDTVKAMQKTYHPSCFVCKHCQQPILGGSFHLDQGEVYCDKDYSALFSTKCFGCQFPIEMGDNWIEAVGQNWHGECFNCTTCHVNLENQGFVNKGGRPYCKEHASAARA